MASSGKSGDGGSEAARTVFFGLAGVHVTKGSHIAHFFRGERERLAVLAPFMRAGLEAGDQCVLVADSEGHSVVRDRMVEEGVEWEKASSSGQLLVSDGRSEVEEMAALFESVVEQARSGGRDIIRIGGDMSWALGKMPTAEKLLEWEAFYDKFVGPRSAFVALCQYDHSRFGGSAITYALQTHPLSIIGSVVQENPFYRDPDEVLKELSGASPPG